MNHILKSLLIIVLAATQTLTAAESSSHDVSIDRSRETVQKLREADVV